ncbi:hypothetical protein [Variovorax sp. YR216]|uniref:hypothetical protein n=1 Tax=Variovorax sp. YR216 TaxID=1882828 RepID=UPI000B8133FB|nr:hypothetical protein [Variovorax sp. YR216]
MKIVIQCAGNKNPTRTGFRHSDGRIVKFVAYPQLALDHEFFYARPDDDDGHGTSWRNRLAQYNSEQLSQNPLGLNSAYKLYKNRIYEGLFNKFGEKVYILSAGWGLIASTFLTPDYDITFSGSAHSCNRRRAGDRYLDFCQIPDDGEEMVFLGGLSYLNLFRNLVMTYKGEKTVYYRSSEKPELGLGFNLKKFDTPRKTNWHYECAAQLIDCA